MALKLNQVERFDGVTPERMERIRAAVLAKSGLHLAGDEGDASAKGVTVHYAYSQAAQHLEVTLTDRKFFDPDEQTLDNMIHSFIQEELTS